MSKESARKGWLTRWRTEVDTMSSAERNMEILETAAVLRELGTLGKIHITQRSIDRVVAPFGHTSPSGIKRLREAMLRMGWRYKDRRDNISVH